MPNGVVRVPRYDGLDIEVGYESTSTGYKFTIHADGEQFGLPFVAGPKEFLHEVAMEIMLGTRKKR